MATEDILINDGDSFVSLSALAAEQVDAKLPIESDDGTVKLDSPSANTFTVSTGGLGRLKITDKGYVGFGTDPTYRFEVQGLNSSGEAATDKMFYSGGIMYLSNTANAATGFYLQANNTSTADRSMWGFTTQYPAAGKDSNLEIRNSGFKLSGSDAPPIFSFTTDENFVVHKGEVQVSRIVGSAAPATDASIDLSANLTVSTGGEERLEVSDDAVISRVDQVLQINKNATTAPNNAGNVNNKQMMTLRSTDEAGAKFIGVSFQHVLSGGNGASACIGLQDESADGVPNKGEMQFVIRGDASSQVTTPLKINKDAIIVNGQVKTPSVSGLDDNDASIQLGAELLTSNHTPTQPNSIATKKIVDDKIQVMTTAEYLAIDASDLLPTTLYCLTD